jgi:hypothetical protein
MPKSDRGGSAGTAPNGAVEAGPEFPGPLEGCIGIAVFGGPAKSEGD